MMKGTQRLSGKSVLLSASVPTPDRDERYRRIEDAAVEIEQAVIALARAVFCEGGTLIFGGAPSISPLVAAVAGEYRLLAQYEGGEPKPPIQIFQSKLFNGHLPEDTLLLERMGLAEIRWTEAVAGERYDPKTRRYEKSLTEMRRRMVREPDVVAMVAIGGMEGVEEEFKLFDEHSRGIKTLPRPALFALERSGGAAALAKTDGPKGITFIDTEVMEQLRKTGGSEPGPEASTPYPLIMQTLVVRAAGQGDSLG